MASSWWLPGGGLDEGAPVWQGGNQHSVCVSEPPLLNSVKAKKDMLDHEIYQPSPLYPQARRTLPC